jgi:uncharacterized protein (DUF2236 family)
VADMRSFGAAFGADAGSLPATFADLEAYICSMVEGDALAIGDDGRQEAGEMLWPRGIREGASGPLLRSVTAGLLPEPVGPSFGLPSEGSRRAAFSALAGASRVAVRTMPRRLRWWPHYRTACARVGGT